MFYHAIPLKNIRYGALQAHPSYSAPLYLNAYLWLEQHIGFYPFFVAVGQDPWSPYEMTGFNANYKTRITAYSKVKQKPVNCRNPEKSPNLVLFRFKRSAFNALHYQDYDAWHGILNTYCENASEAEWSSPDKVRFVQRLSKVILKPNWTEGQWLQKVVEDPGSVQATTPILDLRLADRVYCKTQKTRNYLQRLGFKAVLKYKPVKYEKPLPFL